MQRASRAASALTIIVLLSALSGPLHLAASAASEISPTRAAGSIVWVSRASAADNTLRAIACPTASRCLAVGDSGTVLASANAGASWTRRPTGTIWDLVGVTCLTSSVCLAVGHGGTILASGDGGRSWTDRSSATSPWTSRAKCPANSPCLTGIACPTSSRCLAVGINGTILAGSLSGAVSYRAGTQVGPASGQTVVDTIAIQATPYLSAPDNVVRLARSTDS